MHVERYGSVGVRVVSVAVRVGEVVEVHHTGTKLRPAHGLGLRNKAFQLLNLPLAVVIVHFGVSQTLCMAMTRPACGSMKCNRWEGVELAASMTPA